MQLLVSAQVIQYANYSYGAALTIQEIANRFFIVNFSGKAVIFLLALRINFEFLPHGRNKTGVTLGMVCFYKPLKVVARDKR